jgi:hypothetical protein
MFKELTIQPYKPKLSKVSASKLEALKKATQNFKIIDITTRNSNAKQFGNKTINPQWGAPDIEFLRKPTVDTSSKDILP